MKNLRDCFKWSGNIITPLKLSSFYRMLVEEIPKEGENWVGKLPRSLTM